MNDQELRQWLHKTFEINSKDLSKYKIALTVGQYQILEFFGDSILGFIVSEYLFTKYPDSIYKLGQFHDIRRELIKNENLTRIANKIGLASAVIISNTSNRQQLTDSVAADILEALIAAIYLDQGIKKCKVVIEKVFDLERTIPKV